MSAATAGGRGKLIHLQGLRAIAASAVVVDHAIDAMISRGLLAPAWHPTAWVAGWLGVATFFAISGLIMIRTSIDQFGSTARAGRFLRKRIARVVPLYWLATMVYAVLRTLTGDPVALPALLRSLLFLPYRDGAAPVMRPVVGQGWTLNLEMVFYLWFALCLLLPRRIGLAVLLAAFPAVLVAGLAVRPLLPYADPLTPLQFWSDPIILMFAAGIAIGLVGQRPVALAGPGWPWVGAIALLTLGGGAFVDAGGQFPLQLPWQIGLGALCAIAVWLCVAFEPGSGGSGVRHRLAGLMERAGDASFSVYLFHPIVLTVLAAAATRLPLTAATPWLFVGGALILCNGIGYVLYRMVERPMGNALQPFRSINHPA